jgi:Cu+-exporting ATPase
MHCAGCVKTIEDAANAVPGVRSATVNFATGEAHFDVDPAGEFSAPRLQQALVERGYRLRPHRKIYRVSALDPSAVAGLEARLRSLPGVLAASANAVAGSVAVDVLGDSDPGILLRAEGFDPRPESLADRDAEGILLAWRTGVALVLSAVLMALMAAHLGSHALWALLAAPVQFGCGWPFHAGLLRSIRHGRADMNTLVSLGSSAAYFASPLFPMPYYDGAAMIIAVVLLGRLLEHRARSGSRRAVEALLELAPSKDLKPGDERFVKPGERFPADGVVVQGSGPVDESMLTGESLPVDKSPGCRVIGGTLNRSGALLVRFDRTGDDAVLAQIVRHVRRAQAGKPVSQRTADAVAAVFVPFVVALSIAVALGWLLSDPSRSLLRAVSVLVVACPCAFGLATPMAVLAATLQAARRGLLFKDAVALEAAGRLRRVILDKTGTLTQGRPAVVGVEGADPGRVIRVAAAVERGSEHPLARAIVEKAGPGPVVSDFEARPGLGAVGVLDGREAAVGNRVFFGYLGLDPGPPAPEGRSAVHVAEGGRTIGRIDLADPLRPEARGVVEALRDRGLHPFLLSGDDAAVVEAVAGDLGIAEFKGGVMPQDKADVVAAFQKCGTVAMVGDGINDAAALARADLGVAMHRGSDAALESADLLLLRSGLGGLVEAIDLARRTRRVIRQNIAWAIGYNALLIPVAAGWLEPWGLRLDPMLAATAMALSSLSVTANSLRLSGR